MGTEFIRQNRMALLLPSRKNLLFRRVGLLPDRNENQPNVGRGFTPRRKKLSAGYKTLPYKGKSS